MLVFICSIQDGKNKEFTVSVPAHPLTLKNLSETVCAKEELLMPSLFSVRKKEKNETARLSLPGYDMFSDSFSINTLGVSGTVTVTSKDRHNPERVYSVNISRAPGIFARSLVLTITPTYIVMNQTGTTVSLRQIGSEEKITLHEGGYQAFHWMNKNAKHQVQVLLEETEYDWSEGVELVPSHHSLQLKHRVESKRDPRPRTNLEDPVEKEWSVIQVDISCVDSQCFVFIKKMDPTYLPFCLTNNTALDMITVIQEKAPYETALTLPPLTSRLYTLPLVNEEQTLCIYTHALDAPIEKASYTAQLSVDVSKPGKLGVMRLKNPERTVNVRMEMQKSMKVILFEEVPNKSLFTLMKRDQKHNHLHYLLQRRRDLLEMSARLDDRINEQMTLIRNYIDEQEASGSGIPPSARSTYLKLMYGVDTGLQSGRVMRAKLQFQIGSEWYETGMNRGKLNYWNMFKVCSEEEEVEMKMEVRGDLQRSVVGYAKLRLLDYVQKDCMYDIMIPFYSNEGVAVGEANICFVNTNAPEIAEAGFMKELLYEQKNEVEMVIQRLYNEVYVEKTLGRSQTSDRSLSRASHTGVYRSHSSTSSRSLSVSSLSVEQLSAMDGEETTDDLEMNMSFCLMIHELKQIPLQPENLQGVYITAKIGSSQLRLPASVTVMSDEDAYPQEEVSVTCSTTDFGCQFAQEGNNIVVNQLVIDSQAERCGVRVGHILTDVDGEGAPKSLEWLQEQLEMGEETTLSFVAPPVHDCSRVIFEQQLLFPAGVTVGQQVMHLCVYQEKEQEEDILLSQVTLPISREADADSCIRISPMMSCYLSTSWNSFDVDSEIVQLSVNTFIQGVGVSIVNSLPTEVLYVSLNKFQAVLTLNENGKKTVEVKLNSCQVDNQILGTKYPVLFGSPIDLENMNWLHFSAVILPHPSVLYLQYCSLLVQVDEKMVINQ